MGDCGKWMIFTLMETTVNIIISQKDMFVYCQKDTGNVLKQYNTRIAKCL
jgi:hypothetical protein